MAFVNEAQRWKDPTSLTAEIPISYTPAQPSYMEHPDLHSFKSIKNKIISNAPFGSAQIRFEPLVKEPIPTTHNIQVERPLFDEFQSAV